MNLITEPKNLSSFERLIFAQAYIKELKALLDKAEEDIEELKLEIASIRDLSKIADYKAITKATTQKYIKLKREYESLQLEYFKLKYHTK